MAAPVSVTWLPEDDLLLKNAVESGASLEALAKGAVQFSRRFSLKELQDRWHALLYDPVVLAEAATRMFELEVSGFSPLSRNSKNDHSKGNKEVSQKRKIGSIRKRYYTMRKRFRNEFFNPADLGFLDEPNLPHGGGHVADFPRFNGVPQNGTGVLGNPVPNHLDFHEAEIEILRSAFSKPDSDTPAAVNNHSLYLTGCSNKHEDKHPDRILRKCGSSKNVSTSFGQNGMIFEPNVKTALPSFPKDRSVNFDEHSGIHESRLPQSLEMHRLSVFDSTKDNPKNVIRGSRQEQHLSSPRGSSLHGVAFSSAQPDHPLWDTVDKFSTGPMPASVERGDTVEGADDMLADDGKGNGSFGYEADHSGPTCGVSEGEFGDLPDSLLNLSNEDEILMADVDGKATSEKACFDHLHSLLTSSLSVAPEDGISNLEPETMIAPESCLANPNCVDHKKSDAITSPIHGDDPDIHHPEDNDLYDPTLAFDYHDLGIDDGNVICTLNTEDPEIPCNDDIFLLIHPSSSRGASTSQPSRGDQVELSAASQKKSKPGMTSIMDIKDDARSSKWSQKTGLNILPQTPSPMSLVAPKIKSELHDLNSKDVLSKVVKKTIGDLRHSGSSHANASVSASGKPGDDILRLDFKAGEASATLPGLQIAAGGSADVVMSESPLNPSDQEESESDDDLPYFSDVEAMILEMDLDPLDEDTQRTKLVSRYQTEGAKMSIIRMEQCVQSCLQRALTSLGAFAVFYGRHLKHYIRKTEVILGRSTADAEVDIDLRKEGRANKISRQQALVKMEGNGSFYLKNLGKSVISVNGKSVARGQLICLSLSCLIEIRGMSFIFETNQKYIRQYMSGRQKDKGKKSSIERLADKATKAH